MNQNNYFIFSFAQIFFTKIKFTQNGFKGKKWIVKMDFETS